MMFGTAENRVLEGREAVKLYQNSGKKWLFEVFARLRWRFYGKNR